MRAVFLSLGFAMDMRLKGKSALVCGGSGGIGLACAKALAEEGVAIVIVGRDRSRLDKALIALAGVGEEARAVSVDMSSPVAVATLLDVIEEVDILLTNPGGSPTADILGAGEAWSKGIEQFVAQPMAIVEAYLAGMRARRFGRVINITSSAFAFASPGLAFSGALRAALTHTAANLARRIAADGVTVNNIAPGPVESDGLHEFLQRMAREQNISVAEARALRLKDTPTQRFADPAEIGRMAVFLASPHAASLTGRTMLMDGGANPYPFL
jgi:3-oxoacyl-[acyl-carrier protein] reductase